MSESEKCTFKIGDVVYLKGHSVPMTVVGDGEDHTNSLLCYWYATSSSMACGPYLNKADFPKESLCDRAANQTYKTPISKQMEAGQSQKENIDIRSTRTPDGKVVFTGVDGQIQPGIVQDHNEPVVTPGPKGNIPKIE